MKTDLFDIAEKLGFLPTTKEGNNLNQALKNPTETPIWGNKWKKINEIPLSAFFLSYRPKKLSENCSILNY